MKSLSRSTPLVRTNSSNGGHPSVYMWLSIVSAVISSALGYTVTWDSKSERVGGDSAWSVADDETESSTSSDRVDDDAGDVSLFAPRLSPFSWICDKSF